MGVKCITATKDKIMVYHIDLPQYKQSQFMTKLEYKELLELEKHIKNA